MSFPLYFAFNCVLRQNVIRLIFYLLFLIMNHSIASLSIRNHSIDFKRQHSIASVWVHSIVPETVPVTTRSMTKRATNSPCTLNSSVFLLSPHQTPSSSLRSPDILLSTSLVDVSALDNFDISIFQNTSVSFVAPDPSLSQFNFESLHNFNMEWDKNNEISTKSKESANECILQMLTMVLNQIMASIQVLQEHMLKSNEKLSQDIGRITEDHENFKQEMRHELTSLHQSQASSSRVLSSSTPLVNSVPPLPDPPAVSSSAPVRPPVSSPS